MKISRALLVATVVASVSCHRDADPPAAEPPAVRVAAVETATLTDWQRLSGRVVPPPDHDATLSPRVAGVLAEVEVRAGDRVKRGQIVARVDTAALGDELAAAVAAEQSAAADAEAKRHAASRTKALLERGVVSGEQAETDEAAAVAAEAAYAQARAARTTASRRQAWATITAPFDGVVVKLLRQTGDSVDGTPATPVAEIAAEHPVMIALDATAAVLGRLAEGQAAEVFVGVDDTRALAARVTSVAASVDPAIGVGQVRLDPTEEEPTLLLGRVVEARIAVARHDNVLVVPASALRGAAEGSMEVVAVIDRTAHPRKVETGIRDGDRVEIVSGLEPGQRIVVDDPSGLADGQPVQDRS